MTLYRVEEYDHMGWAGYSHTAWRVVIDRLKIRQHCVASDLKLPDAELICAALNAQLLTEEN